MKKLPFATFALVFLGMVLTSCNGGGGSSLPGSSPAPSSEPSSEPSVTSSSIPSSSPELNRYTITWLNYDSTILEIDNGVPEGTMPTYDGATPTKGRTAEFTYTFSGWSPRVEPATCNATYFATFDESINTYTINWNIEGVITSETYRYGEMPSFKGEVPEKEGDAQYSYSFTGWQPALTEVVGDATYTAMFDETVNTYTVTWVVNGDSTEETYSYGDSPSYKLGTPQKPSTAQYSYTFSEWYPALSEVTGDATYTAMFDETVNTYTVTWVINGESTEETYEFGETPEYKKGTPSKPSTAQYSYTFSEWYPALSEVTGDATYTAMFDSAINSYTITWIIDGQSTSETYEYGQTPSYKGGTPHKPSTAQYHYVFTGWSPAISAVMCNAIYEAQFVEYVNAYNITWKNYDGTTLKTDRVSYGQTPVYSGSMPQKPSTAQYSYSFAGWSPTVATVTGDATYTAIFSSEVRTYTITWKNADGTILEVDKDVPYGSTPSYDGSIPTMQSSDPENPFLFKNWSPQVAPVTSDATYWAVYTGGAKNEYVFEAENCSSLEDLNGATWSGGASYLGMIGKDVYNTGDAKASAGYFVHYNYLYGNTLYWTIESDREVDDLTFIARFAAEYRDFPTYLDNGDIDKPAVQPDNFIISLNDSPIDYLPICLDAPEQLDHCGGFSDFTIGVHLHLKVGENVIKMIVNNTIIMQGTAIASSPVIDCIKLSTSASLEFTDEDPTLPHIAWD